MRLRNYLAAVLASALWVLAGCQTFSGGGGGTAQSDKPFASEDEFTQWFAFYYQHPQPERVTSGLAYMENQHYLREFPDIASTFLSRVFAAHPDDLKEWTDGWKGLGPEEWNCILVALWLTNTPASRDLMTANLGRAAPMRQEHLRDMLKEDPSSIDPMTADVLDARQIMMIWAAFSATGDERYIRKVIAYVHLYGEDEQNERESEVGEAALMTLATNSIQHEKVEKVCEEEDLKNPDPRTRVLLKAMLSALAQMQSDGEIPALPSH